MLSGNIINAPVRRITAKVELYNGSTLATTFEHTDELKSFTVERVGENNKFFGYGICQRLNVKLRDVYRQINITTDNSFKTYLGSIAPYPTFNVTEVNRAENTNELSITAYDAIQKAAAHTVAELPLDGYTVREFAAACANLIGASGIVIIGVGADESCFDTYYEGGANFSGSETIRAALNAVAEVTQTIYYLNNANQLVFKRLDINGKEALNITKNDYITLDSKTNRRLSRIVSATELGDNLEATGVISGTTQTIKNNPFWDLREDRAALVNAAFTVVDGLTINQFECSWRGNYLLEIGDKITLVTKNNKTVVSYVLDDTVTYNGGFSQKTKWSYSDTDEESAAAPTNLGNAIKETYAKVDKVNKQIDIVAGEATENAEAIAALKLNTDSINASVTKIQEETIAALEGVNTEVATLTTKVEAAITTEAVELAIKKEMESGANKVTTATGFTFDENGLTVTKTDSEIETTITENGMTVYKDDEEVLVANNVGVQAMNLHANTYLIIGTNSRFEDYDNNTRTGCFWIG